MSISAVIPRGHLHTDGARIVSSDGRTVRLAGVNWYGFECSSMVPGGLDRRTIDEVCEMVVALGFNHIRLPYCDQVLFDNPRISVGLAANAALQGHHALEILDEVIAAAGRHHLRVVIDNHRSEAGWSAQENGLWYSRRFSTADWLHSLQRMAERYRGNDTVIGIDLRNEPGSPPIDPEQFPRNGGAEWGERDHLFSRHPRDWAAAAERGGNAVLKANPDLLVFVEGVRGDPAGPVLDSETHLYWPGGNLCGVRSAGGRRPAPRPIRLRAPGRLVYSVHDYGPDMHPQLPWCRPDDDARAAQACRSVWEQAWGFIVRQGIAPLYVGEFGTRTRAGAGDDSPPETFTDAGTSSRQGRWFSHLVEYMHELEVSWAYWPLNGDQPPSAGRRGGEPEWYGILAPDWRGPASAPLMARLEHLRGQP